MKILTKVIRISFFVSFFLPFLLIPHCEGPSAEEKFAKENSMLDSMRICNSTHKTTLIDTEVKRHTIIKQSRKSDSYYTAKQPKTINPEERNSTVFAEIHKFLQCPTENSISGYGIASLSSAKGVTGITPFVLLFSIILSFAGIVMLFVRRNHILQTVISTLAMLFLILFLFLGISDNTTIDVFMWGFWACLFLSFTNVIITLRNKRLLFAKDKRMSANNKQV